MQPGGTGPFVSGQEGPTARSGDLEKMFPGGSCTGREIHI